MQHPAIVVVAAGEGPDVRALLPEAAFVIAADGGVERAHALGLEVALVVGDLDSASPEAVAAAKGRGAVVARHPTEKDATDLELALEEAASRSPLRLVVVASAAGRLDHLLSSLHVLASPALAGIEVDALVGDALVHVVRDERLIHGRHGELVTLQPIGGPAEGVTTNGLAYPLEGETLHLFSSRGVSNVLSGTTGRIAVVRGTLLAIRSNPPGAPR